MPARFVTVDTLKELEELIAASDSRPVFLFKHSNSCGISAHIRYQLSSLDADVYQIVVQESRPVSHAVAEKLGVRHASPQAFVLTNGNVIYHATHYGIDPTAIQKHLEPAKPKP
jgi:thioredoxin 1